MKHICLFILTAFLSPLLAQEVEERTLQPYQKLVVHPYIDVELDQSSDPKIFISVDNWSLEDVIIEQKGKKLEVYLRGAHTDKVASGSNTWKKFRNVRVKIFLTYENLEKVSMRGDGSFHCRGPIEGEDFIFTLMGDSEAKFTSWDVDYLKTTIMGDGRVEMGKGQAHEQVWEVLGDGEIEATSLKGKECRLRLMGDSDIRIYATKKLSYKLFGESHISYRGNPNIAGTFSLGEKHIRRIAE